MPAPKSFLFQNKVVVAADKKHTIAFWTTLTSVVATAIFTILSTATVFSTNPNAQIVVMVVGIVIMAILLVFGTLAMNIANNDFIRAADLALQKQMLEQFNKLTKPHV